MSDYSEAEQLCYSTFFPTANSTYVTVHHEQSWERWALKIHNHGLTKCEGEELLGLLRECAHAPASRPTANSRLMVTTGVTWHVKNYVLGADG